MAVNDRTRMLSTSIQRLLRRGASPNIQRILQKTHSADIADVLESLSQEEAYEVFRLQSDTSERASILSYLNTDLQKYFMDRLSTDEAAQIVENMESDDAADLLSQLPIEESTDIIKGMGDADFTEVVDLMGYPDDSAGGLMSSDYAAFTEDTTVEQVIQNLQDDEGSDKVTFYIYVLNSVGMLVGVVSLKQLLLAKKTMQMRQLMHASVISVRVDTDQEHVAQIVERYDFLSVPVVDESNKLVGVITVDDVIDVIREEAQEDLLSMGQAGWGVDMTFTQHLLARLPWQAIAFVAGSICFGIIYSFGVNIDSALGMNRIWGMTAFVPLLLAMGSMVGNQSATVMVGALQTGRYIGGRFRTHFIREILLSLVFSLLAGCLVWLLGKWLLPQITWAMHLALAMSVQMIATIVLGSLFPFMMNKLKVDPAIATVPLVTALADISALVVLFGFYHLIQPVN